MTKSLLPHLVLEQPTLFSSVDAYQADTIWQALCWVYMKEQNEHGSCPPGVHSQVENRQTLMQKDS